MQHDKNFKQQTTTNGKSYKKLRQHKNFKWHRLPPNKQNNGKKIREQILKETLKCKITMKRKPIF